MIFTNFRIITFRVPCYCFIRSDLKIQNPNFKCQTDIVPRHLTFVIWILSFVFLSYKHFAKKSTSSFVEKTQKKAGNYARFWERLGFGRLQEFQSRFTFFSVRFFYPFCFYLVRNSKKLRPALIFTRKDI